jgi:hypothetical protein
MVYRNGELSKSQVDKGWPHQVALPEDRCSFKNYEIHAAFNKGLSLCARGHSVNFDGIWYRVFCYSLKDDAEAFLARFGGEWFDPDQRGKAQTGCDTRESSLVALRLPRKASERPVDRGADYKE